VIITVDQSFSFSKPQWPKIALLILCAPTNRLRDLQELVPAALAALKSIKPGAVVSVR